MRENEALTSVLCLLACLGCGLGSEDLSRNAGMVGDSAGIRLVHHGAETEGALSIPRALEPDLRIGPDPLRPETQFGHLADLVVDDDGRIYALDQQARHVVVFGPEGTTLRIIGAPGEGPGELGRFAWSLALTADTLAVVDWGRGVLHRFVSDGSYVDAPRLGLAGGTRSWWRPAAEGGFLARALTRFIDDEGRWRSDDRLLRIAADGAVRDTVFHFGYAESDLGGPGDSRVPLIVNTPIWAELPDGRIAWTTLASSRVRILGSDGALRALLGHEAWIRRPVADRDRPLLLAALREKIEGLGGDGSAVETFPLIWPDRYPAVTGLLAGPDTTLWVQRMGEAVHIHPTALNTPEPPVGFGGATWDVFDGELAWTGAVELPAGFRPFGVRGEAVYGVSRDALDREVILRIRRRSGRPALPGRSGGP